MQPSDLPYNIEAEEAVIGSCLIDPAAFRLIRPLLKPDSFYREKHAWLWEAFTALDDRRADIDLLTVYDELGGRLDKAGGIGWLTELTLKTPTAIHAEHYARIVRRYATRRATIARAERLARAAYDDDMSESDLIALAYQNANELSQAAPIRAPRPAERIARDAYERFERRQAGMESTGIPTPSKRLTEILGGWKKGNLYILGARPAIGKTSFATVSLKVAGEAGARGLMFELEMAGEDLFDRLAAEHSGVELEKIREGRCDPDEEEQVAAAYDYIGRLPLSIDDVGNLTVEGARATIARHKAEHPDLELVVVDYAQRMTSESRRRREQRYEELKEVSSQLKAAAREYDVAVLLIAAVGRGVEARDDKRPRLADLRESGDLEFDADVVIFLYRDELYNPRTDRPNIAEIIVAKHRHGALGRDEMYFQKATGRWKNLSRFEDEPPPPYRNGRSGRSSRVPAVPVPDYDDIDF